MKKTLHQLGLLVALLMGVTQVSATNWTNFSNFTDVTNIAVNGNQVWVAAKGGLMLYDKGTGSKTYFKKETGQLPSLSVERVALNTATNSIWIGTYDNGIARYNGSGFDYHPFPVQGAKLYDMEIAANGDIWCSTDNGLFKWENNQFTSYVNSLASGSWDIALFPDGRILCAGNQAYIYDPVTNQVITPVSQCFAYASGSVYVKNDSVYYFATDRGELAEFHDTTEVDTFQVNSLLLNLRTNANGNLIGLDQNRNLLERHGHQFDTIAFGKGQLTAYITEQDGMWGGGVNNDYGKLLHVDAQGQVAEIPLRKAGIQDNWVYKMTTAEDGNVLLTTSAGIQKFDVNRNQFDQEWNVDSISGSNFSEALQLNGDLYVGTGNHYLMRYRNNQWEQLGNGALPNSEVSHLTRDASGNLWMGGAGYVAKFDGLLFTIYNAANAPVITNNLYIRDIYCDSTHSTVWIATYSGIIKFTNNNFTLLNDTNTVGIQQGYHPIETIAEDNAHNIYFGTVYGAVIKYDGTAFSTLLLPVHVGNQFVSSIAFKHDTMYVSDNLNGVWVYQNGQFDTLNTLNSGLADNFVYDLLVDRAGNLWISHLNYGADVYNKDGVTVSKVEEVASLDARVCPNPSTGKFLLKTTEQLADIEVFTLTGMLVQQLNTNSTNTIIDLSGQARGMYFATIKTTRGKQTVKLIVQ